MNNKKSCFICNNKYNSNKRRWKKCNNIPSKAIEYGIEKKYDKAIDENNDIICNSCSAKVYDFINEHWY